MSNLPFSPEHAHELAIHGTPVQEVASISVLDRKKYVRERAGDFTDSRLKSKLGSAPVNELVLLPPEISGIKTPPNNIDSDIHITIIPGLELGRKNSRSVVNFAQLYIDSHRNKPITEIVAIKYVHSIPAIREMHASLVVNRRFGLPLAYDPLGFIKHPDGNLGYVTRYEHNVVSLDNILWNAHSTPPQLNQAMARSGFWMAELHNKGVIHGDAQAKNIALDSTGSPRYIDLEGAADMQHGPLDTATKRLLDISNLFDPDSIKREVSADEIIYFADQYTRAQDGSYPELSVEDIMDTVSSMKERH